jgi:hypothetical protein
VLRWAIAGGGALGLLLAVEAFVALLFVLMDAFVGSDPSIFRGGVGVLILLPGLILVGLAAAWGAWEFWLARVSEGAEPAGAASR